jgi:steroid 5-alpha reductase family enzyme
LPRATDASLIAVALPSPLYTAVLACAAFAVLCWVISLITGNCSQVDRFWSIAPPLYVAWFAAQTGFRDARLDVMLVLTALWGVRLTYNFGRKGGYRPGSEDYRWPVLRKRMGPALFQVFNATFIASYQNLILLLLALPAWAAYEHRGAPLTILDGVATVGFVVLLAGETVADEQQWAFQQDKKARRERGEQGGAEFVTDGLFRWSRHPNFFCEQGMWWMVYLFSIAAGAPWANVTIVGPVLLVLLFQGSTAFTERLSVAKYPSYREYQRTTSRLLPLPPRPQ